MTLPKWLTTATPLSKILAGLFFITFPIMGFILGMQYQPTLSIVENNEEAFPTIPANTNITKTSPTIIPLKPTKVLSQEKNKTEASFPIVVFEPPLSNPDHTIQKNELIKKVVEPFIDYNYEAQGNDYIVSLLISENKEINLREQYPYQIVAINKEGGSLYESLTQKNGSLNWWIPTCMECKFSSSFKAKYPEIMKQFSP
jgi:hypothetical protein